MCLLRYYSDCEAHYHQVHDHICHICFCDCIAAPKLVNNSSKLMLHGLVYTISITSKYKLLYEVSVNVTRGVLSMHL